MTRLLLNIALVLVATDCFAGDEKSFSDAVQASGVAGPEFAHAYSAAIWDSGRSAAVVAFHRQMGSLVLFVFRQPAGDFRVIDISRIEDANFGRLGTKRGNYDRFESQPTECVSSNYGDFVTPRDDTRFRILVSTKAWRSGRRYTTSETLFLKADGTPLWR